MNIGLDYDGTITEAPDIFRRMVQAFRAKGHKVYIVTMRYASEGTQLQMDWAGDVDGIIFTNRQAKQPVTESLGIPIHIWMDDNPKAIHMSAEQIWGWKTEEGVVMTPNHTTGQDVTTDLREKAHEPD